MEGPGLREALFMLADRCIVLSSYRVPPWLAIGRFNVLLALFGEFGPAFLAATVLVTKSCSFHPCFLYTSLNSWCCHIVNKTWPANFSTLGVYFCRCRVIFIKRSTPPASSNDLKREREKKVRRAQSAVDSTSAHRTKWTIFVLYIEWTNNTNFCPMSYEIASNTTSKVATI
jgi:hypothetical protein